MVNSHRYDMSELEREFESGLQYTAGDAAEEFLEREIDTLFNEKGTEDEFETEVPEYGSDEEEHEWDDPDDSGAGEFEYGYKTYQSDDNGTDGQDEQEYEMESSYFPPSPYAERLYELTQREFEHEYELQASLNNLVEDMHREFFFGALRRMVSKGIRKVRQGIKTGTRLVKKGITAVNRNPMLKSLIEKGIQHVADSYAPGTGGIAVAGLRTALEPLSEGMTQRAEGLLQKGIDTVQGKASSTAADLMKKFGIDPEKGTDAVKGGLQNLIDSLKKSFEFAADNLHADVDDPIAAERLATQAFEVGIMQGVQAGSQGKHAGQSKAPRGTRIIRLQEKPGEEIEKIVIVIRDRPGK